MCHLTSWKTQERVPFTFQWKTSHVATLGWNGCWETQSLAKQLSPSDNYTLSKKDNKFLADSYPSLPQPTLAHCCDSELELGKAPNARPQIKATALSVKIGTALIKVSLNSILQTGNQRVNSWQTSKDEIPFIAKERMSPYLQMRESCPVHTVSSHAVIKWPSNSPHLSESLLISPATLSCPLSFLHDQLQSTQTFDTLVQLEGIIQEL